MDFILIRPKVTYTQLTLFFLCSQHLHHTGIFKMAILPSTFYGKCSIWTHWSQIIIIMSFPWTSVLVKFCNKAGCQPWKLQPVHKVGSNMRIKYTQIFNYDGNWANHDWTPSAHEQTEGDRKDWTRTWEDVNGNEQPGILASQTRCEQIRLTGSIHPRHEQFWAERNGDD